MGKTDLTKRPMTSENVQEAISNPEGMIVFNNPESIKVIAKKMHEVLQKLHQQKKAIA